MTFGVHVGKNGVIGFLRRSAVESRVIAAVRASIGRERESQQTRGNAVSIPTGRGDSSNLLIGDLDASDGHGLRAETPRQ